MTPFFSIIIPLYNKEKHIKATIESVLAQTFVDFEIIIVNDGSTDGSEAIVKSIDDERIQMYSQENKGVSAARNFGITKATADCIAFLDADDLWYPNHLESLKNLYHAFPNCGLYAMAYLKNYQNAIIKSKYYNIPETPNWAGLIDDYFESSIYNSIAWTSAVMVPKAVLKQLNGFDETITLGAGEDIDLWIRIALSYNVAFSNVVTAIHNLHADNRLSNTNTNKRVFINLDIYENAVKSNRSLKKYLDLNRFSIGLQYVLAGNKEKAKALFKSLDPKNLNKKQRFLMRLNKPLVSLFVRLQKALRFLNIHLSSFR